MLLLDLRSRYLHGRPVQAGHLRTKTFIEPRLCAAIVDRLTFNATIIDTGTRSYRLAPATQRAKP